ncbi:unnamed protein product [Blepharisma stoltei]|uniref:Uncharacterized protein n=1 Tax=Blepharisma stoltei TaxID=1481888 RepID=A0AAU9IWQ6_9CILI|nr:unnamed protein product [Blepharisma stoltei]
MEDRVHTTFTQAANALTTLFKDSQHACNRAYSKGREDTAQEIFNMCLELRSQGLKYVNPSLFLERFHSYSPDMKITDIPESRKRCRN